MDDIAPKNRAFLWSAHAVQELYALGLRHAVISPGSRSTPLTLAFATHPEIRKHTILDERSAAYTALGIGKATNQPAALVCTSVTAAANYYPAAIEARQSGVPLLLLTADRPPNLRNVGANQAIDQLKLFGDYPVFFHEVGEAVFEAHDIQRLRMAADQAWSTSIERSGPAHLNFPFRKPLEPEPDFIESAVGTIYQTEDPIPQTKPEGIDQPPRKFWPESIISSINQSERPLIIAGPVNPGADQTIPDRFVQKIQAPVLAEIGSNLQTGDQGIPGFDAYIRWAHTTKDLKPDLILRLGEQPVSKAVNQFLTEHNGIPHYWIGSDERWHDASLSTTHRLSWPDAETLNQIEHTPDAGWLNSWQVLAQHFNSFRSEILGKTEKLTDGAVFHAFSAQMDPGWNLFLSNSFPVRDADLFGNFERRPDHCFVNRGTSGIDGITSTAIGGTIATGRPGVLFIGDLAFLHDQNALLNGRLLSSPLLIVVLNNGGGTIFRKLPIAQHREYFNEYFETSQSIHIEDLARAHDIPYDKITEPAGLKGIELTSFTSNKGIMLLECITDADASMNQREQLWGGPTE